MRPNSKEQQLKCLFSVFQTSLSHFSHLISFHFIYFPISLDFNVALSFRIFSNIQFYMCLSVCRSLLLAICLSFCVVVNVFQSVKPCVYFTLAGYSFCLCHCPLMCLSFCVSVCGCFVNFYFPVFSLLFLQGFLFFFVCISYYFLIYSFLLLFSSL